MGADETQEEQIARHLAGDVHDSDVASDADSSSDDDDDDASTSSVEVLSNANGAVPTATAVRFRRRNPKRPNTQSHARYEKYKSATTVQQFLGRGGTRADLRNDVDKGFAKLGKAARRDFDDDKGRARGGGDNPLAAFDEETKEPPEEEDDDDDEARAVTYKFHRAASGDVQQELLIDFEFA